MKRTFQPHRFRTLLRDDGAQALVELTIILPIILLVFFASIQTIVIAQAAQLTTYAAFSAARSYATSYSRFVQIKGNDAAARAAAETRARLAATVVMAPMSHGVPGELTTAMINARESMASMPPRNQRNLALVEGLVMAFVYRIKNFEVSAFDPEPASDRSVFSVSFDYDMPIAIPGLAEMWDYLSLKNEAASTGQPFADELEDYTATTGGQPVSEFLWALENIRLAFFGFQTPSANYNNAINTYRNFVQSTAGGGAAGADVSIRIRAQTMMGLEPWDNATGAGGDDTSNGDPATAHCETELNQLEADYDAQNIVVSNTCEEALNRSNDWVSAKAIYDNCIATEDDPSDCDDEKDDMDDAWDDFTVKEQECEDEMDELEVIRVAITNYVCVPAP